jgi:hypothetical protein
VPVLADSCPACGADPELQLVSVGALEQVGRRGRRRAALAEVGGTHGDDGGSARPRRRSRWPIGVGAIVVIAVAAALVGASSAEDDRDEEAAPPITTSVPAADAGAPSSTSTTGPTSSTGVPATGLYVTSPGSPVVLELDSGIEHRVRAEIVGADGSRLLVDTGAGLAWWPAPFDGQGAELLAEGIDGDQAWVDPTDGTVWLYGYGLDGTLTSVAADGSARVDHEVAPSFIVQGIAGGRMIIGAPGGTYAVDRAGAVERISTGVPMGANADTVYVMVCDEVLLCRVDELTATGEVRRRDAVDPEVMCLSPGLVSSSGRLATMLYPDDGSSDLLIDGVQVLHQTSAYIGGLAWTPDGQRLLVWADNDLLLIDATTSEVVEVPYRGPELGGYPLLVFGG